MSDVVIHYRRLPARDTVFRQRLVHRTPDCMVTFMERTALPQPVTANGAVILEPDAPAIWFTFPGLWHDIGRFHTADGRFTGCYANILTPVVLRSDVEWDTTDLFLDVWLGTDGALTLLDEEELVAGERAGVISSELARAARTEADRLVALALAGSWPPPIVREWTLAKVRGHSG